MTLLWAMSTSLGGILLKGLLLSHPYPLSLSVGCLGVSSVVYLGLWGTGIRRSPNVRRVRARHLPRLGISALLHALAVVLTIHSVAMGSLSDFLLLRTVQFTPNLWALGASLLGVSLSVESMPQSLAVLASNLSLTAQSHIRFDSKRFRGSHNLYGVINILSFVLLLPVAFAVEGMEPWKGLLLRQQEERGLLLRFLGYSLCNFAGGEIAFRVFRRHGFQDVALSDTARRILSLLVVATTLGETVSVEGTLLAFGGLYWTTTKSSSALHAASGFRQRSRSDSESSFTSSSLRSSSSFK